MNQFNLGRWPGTMGNAVPGSAMGTTLAPPQPHMPKFIQQGMSQMPAWSPQPQEPQMPKFLQRGLEQNPQFQMTPPTPEQAPMAPLPAVPQGTGGVDPMPGGMTPGNGGQVRPVFGKQFNLSGLKK